MFWSTRKREEREYEEFVLRKEARERRDRISLEREHFWDNEIDWSLLPEAVVKYINREKNSPYGDNERAFYTSFFKIDISFDEWKEYIAVFLEVEVENYNKGMNSLREFITSIPTLLVSVDDAINSFDWYNSYLINLEGERYEFEIKRHLVKNGLAKECVYFK